MTAPHLGQFNACSPVSRMSFASFMANSVPRHAEARGEEFIPLSLRERVRVRGNCDRTWLSRARQPRLRPHPDPLPEGEGVKAPSLARDCARMASPEL